MAPSRAIVRAPFPWFGGKSRAAHLVWGAFGDVDNYVEPFAGSLAVLLGRPYSPRIETVNDLDCYLANFWRALRCAPEEVARWADWPVNEADLHARHAWLVSREDFRKRIRGDPDYFDAKTAGWWVWGICQWIGAGWCAVGGAVGRLPSIGNSGRGVHSVLAQQTITARMLAISNRLRRVRVCCGDWRRVLSPSATEHNGTTGVLLDPPYGAAAGRATSLYAEDSLSVAEDVREWCLEHGDNRKLRIALCGYDGEHEMPQSWQCVAWKAAGGYAAAAGNHENSKRERIWFSPHCARANDQAQLFEGVAGA